MLTNILSKITRQVVKFYSGKRNSDLSYYGEKMSVQTSYSVKFFSCGTTFCLMTTLRRGAVLLLTFFVLLFQQRLQLQVVDSETQSVEDGPNLFILDLSSLTRVEHGERTPQHWNRNTYCIVVQALGVCSSATFNIIKGRSFGLSYPSRLLLVRCLLVSNNSLFLGLYA